MSTREDEIGRWGEEIVEYLLEWTFSGAEITKQVPDRGTDLFCSIRPSNTDLLGVEWRIQVKATTRPQRGASGAGEVIRCQVRGKRIRDCWSSKKNKWLLFLVVFMAEYAELRTMPLHRKLCFASVYAVDMVRAIEKMRLGHSSQARDSRDYDLEVPMANEATPYLLTLLWASHRWTDIQERLREVSSTMRMVGMDGDRQIRWAQEVWRSLNPWDQQELKLPLAVPAVNKWISRVLHGHRTREGDVILTLQADVVEDVLSCLMDADNHLAYADFSRTSESGATWVIQVGERTSQGPLYERIIAHQLARFMLASGYRVVVAKATDEKVVPETSVPGYGAVVHGFYNSGAEFKNEKQDDREAAERRAHYLRPNGGKLLTKPVDTLRKRVLQAFGLGDATLNALSIARCPVDLLPNADCEGIARVLTSHLVSPGLL